MNTSLQPEPKRLVARPLITAVSAALSIGSAHAQIDDGLLSYWDFENNFSDTATNFSPASTVADNGTGGASVVFSTDGPLGTYGDFQRDGEGAANFVTIPNSADLDASGEDLTISLWFRVDGFDEQWQALIAHGEGSDWRMSRLKAESRIGFAGGTGDIPGRGGNSTEINDGEWHHVVAISENGVSTRIWIDGVLIASGGAPTITDNESGFLYIGGNPDANVDATPVSNRAWNGGIDDVALWNRPLTASEISQLYSSGLNGQALSSLLSTDDTDGDGLLDAWEELFGLDPNDNGSVNPDNGPNGDPDGDGLININEQTNGTNPIQADSDGDFATDQEEIDNGTLPLVADTDGDGLLDGHETNTGEFVSLSETGTNPLESDLTADSDNDGLFNVWEIDAELDPFDDGTTDVNNGATGDPDSDLLLNLAEQENATDPNDDDSDDDTSLDGAEIDNATDPLNPDSDFDGLLDGVETNNGALSFLSATDTGTDPNLPDTDGDGFDDGAEIILGTDPTDIDSFVTPTFLPIIDDFEDDSINLTTWKTITGTISQDLDGTLRGGNVTETEGSLLFESRGYLHTSREFDPEVVGGLEISGQVTLLSDQDIFSITTRSDAMPGVVFGEVNSGVRFNLEARADTISINSRNGDHTVTNQVIEGALNFVTNGVYLFNIIDDGEGSLSMTISDANTPENVISITADLTADTSDTNFVVLYNREGPRSSNLNEIQITAAAPFTGPEIQQIVLNSDDTLTITWLSQLDTPYAIYASPDLEAFDLLVNNNITGEDGTTTFTFPNPSPGATELFLRVEPPRVVE